MGSVGRNSGLVLSKTCGRDHSEITNIRAITRSFVPKSAPPTHAIYPIYNNDGIVYEKHYNASVELTGEGRLWNHLSVYYQPIFTMFDGEGAEVRLEKG